MKYLKFIPIALVLFFFGTLFYHSHRDIPIDELKERYANEESEFIDIDGLEVHYRDEGEGYPLVLIHGTGASVHTWDGWVKVLKGDYRIIRMDLPAFGLTGPNAHNDYSMDAYLQFLDKFLSKIGIQECYLAGNSLGGGIAWEYARTHTDRVSKLILLDAAGYRSNEKREQPLAFKIARSPYLSKILERITPKSLVHTSMIDVYGDDSKVTDEVVDRYFDMMLRAGNRSAFVARAWQTHNYPIDKLKDISIPVLIMWGEEDTWIPLEFGHNFHRDLPYSKIITYPGVGHIPMEEIPEQSAADAREFLESSNEH